MSDLVGTPNCWFSHAQAHIILNRHEHQPQEKYPKSDRRRRRTPSLDRSWSRARSRDRSISRQREPNYNNDRRPTYHETYSHVSRINHDGSVSRGSLSPYRKSGLRKRWERDRSSEIGRDETTHNPGESRRSQVKGDRRPTYDETYSHISRINHYRPDSRGSLSPYRNGGLRKSWERDHSSEIGRDEPTHNPGKSRRIRDKGDEPSRHGPARQWGEPACDLDEDELPHSRTESARQESNRRSQSRNKPHYWHDDTIISMNNARTNNDRQEKDDNRCRSRQETFDTRKKFRSRRSSTPPSRYDPNSPDRYRHYGSEINEYSRERERGVPKHEQNHGNFQFTESDYDSVSDGDLDNYTSDRESDEYENEFEDTFTRNDYRKKLHLSSNSSYSNAWEKQNMTRDNYGDWHSFVTYSSLKLCIYSGSKDQENCGCEALHICKYFLLSKCLVPDCHFGHDIYTDHNESILKKYFTQKPTPHQLKIIICKVENRNETTVPQICKFYNNKGGCKHEKMNNGTKCPCLHICQYYVKRSCKFDRCMRSHDLFSGHSFQLLRSYGLLPRHTDQSAQEEILDLLDKIAVAYANKKAHRQQFTQPIDRSIMNQMNGKSRSGPENPFQNGSDFIPLATQPKLTSRDSVPQYFSNTFMYVSTDDELEMDERVKSNKHRHRKKRKRSYKDHDKRSKRKRKMSKRQDFVCDDSTGLNLDTDGNEIDTDNSESDAETAGNYSLPTIETGAGADLESNDCGQDANFKTSDDIPDSNEGRKDNRQLYVNQETYDSGQMDATIGTNDGGSDANHMPNEACDSRDAKLDDMSDAKIETNPRTNDNGLDTNPGTTDNGPDTNLGANNNELDTDPRTSDNGRCTYSRTGDNGPDTNPGTNDNGPGTNSRTNDNRPDTNLGANDNGLDTDPRTNDNGPDTNPGTNDNGPGTNSRTNDNRPDTNLGANDNGLDTDPRTNDNGPDTNPGTNDYGPGTNSRTNDNRPDTNLGANDNGLDTDPRTNDNGPDTNPGTNDNGPDTNLGANDNGLDTDSRTNDNGPDTNPRTSDNGPGTNSRTSDNGPDTNPGTNDNGPDTNLGANDNGLDTDPRTNDNGPDTNPGINDNGPGTNSRTSDNGPDTNLGANDNGPGTNPGANDNEPDTNPGANDNGPGTNSRTSDNGPDTNPGTNDNGPDTNSRTNDNRPDTNLRANDNGPDTNPGTNNNGLGTNSRTNDNEPDINPGTNDNHNGPDTNLGTNDNVPDTNPGPNDNGSDTYPRTNDNGSDTNHGTNDNGPDFTPVTNDNGPNINPGPDTNPGPNDNGSDTNHGTNDNGSDSNPGRNDNGPDVCTLGHNDKEPDAGLLISNRYIS